MNNWREWIRLGLAATVALTLLAVWLRGPGVEEDLTERSGQELKEQYGWASVELDGRDLTIHGDAPDENARQAAIDTAKQVYGVRVVADKAGLLAGQDPYTFSAQKTADKIILAGFASSQQEKQSVLEAAKAASGGLEVVDELQLASGAPEGFTDATSFAIGQLGRFSKGKASLSNLDLSVEGMANSTQDYDAAINELGGELPNGLKLASRNISPVGISPYEWNADYDGSSLKLSGYVPSDEARKAILEAAGIKLPNAQIDDQMKIADGAGEAYEPATGFVFERLAEFTAGKASLSDSKLSISGKALSVDGYDSAMTALKEAVPGGITVTEASVEPAILSPYKWMANYDGSSLGLEGYVPGEDMREEMLAKARAALPDVTIRDEMKLAAGATGSYLPNAGFAFASFAAMNKGQAGIEGDKLSISGQASSLENYDALNKSVEGDLPENVQIANASFDPANVDGMYSLTASKGDNSIELSGFAPDSDSVKAIEMAAKEANEGASITNNLKIAAGVPEGVDWSKAGATAVDSLKGLTSGKAMISNDKLSVEGIASSLDSYNSTRQMLGGELAGGLKPGNEAIMPPAADPYQWKIMNSSGKVAISGNIPDDETGEANLAFAKKLFADAPVEANQTLASGMPGKFGDAVTLAMQATSRLKDSEGLVTGTKLTIKGEAKSEDDVKSIEGELNSSLPDGFILESAITAPVVAVPEKKVDCQKLFFDALAREKINFESSKAVLLENSKPVLNDLVEAAKKCSETKIEIAGHTDATGSADTNLKLSQDRADAVKAYLEQAGISAARLSAKGYGSGQPIGDNKTEEGKAANRRIEFRVVR